MADFGFGTGNDAFNRLGRRYVEERPDTRLLFDRRMNSVEDFVDRLENDADIDAPIGNLYIVSHANEEGWLQIRLDDVRRRFGGTTYEVADEAEQSGSVDLDTFLFEPDGGGPTLRRFLRIVGCNVGRAEPFVNKLSEAFGPHVRVRAPRHLNGVYQRRRGMFECLLYSFELAVPDPLADRAAVVQAFRSEGFEFYEGTAADPNLFEAWIPRRLPGRFLQRGGSVTSQHVHGRPTLGRRIDGEERLPVGIELEHVPRNFTFAIDFAGVDAPARRAEQMDALRDSIRRAPVFDDAHPYPQYRRFGYNSVDEFIDGWFWRFARSRRNRRLNCTATRHEYRISVPLVHINTGHLIHNFIPLRGSDTAARFDIPENDPNLIYTSP